MSYNPYWEIRKALGGAVAISDQAREEFLAKADKLRWYFFFTEGGRAVRAGWSGHGWDLNSLPALDSRASIPCDRIVFRKP